MTQTRAERLREARRKAGYDSAQEAAETFGWGVAGYRHHENGTRNFGLDAAQKYGRAFRVKPGWLLGVAGVDDARPAETPGDETLIVRGPVAAGVWREPAEDIAEVEIDTPPPVSGVKRFGVTVEGYSMDEYYEPGTVLDCVSIFSGSVEPETGDHVIVERVKPDGLREMTVKEFVRRGDEFFLRPRSSRAEFQAEMPIGAPSEGHFGDDEVRVIGYVVSAIPPASLRVLERLGKVRRL